MYQVVDRSLNCYVFIEGGALPPDHEVLGNVTLDYEGSASRASGVWKQGDPPPEERLWRDRINPHHFVVARNEPELRGYELVEGIFCGVYSDWREYSAASDSGTDR